MSVIFTVIVVLGLVGAATFLTGFVKGVREAVRDYRHPEPEAAWTDQGHYGLSAFFAVLASAIVIGSCRRGAGMDLCRAALGDRNRNRRGPRFSPGQSAAGWRGTRTGLERGRRQGPAPRP